MKKAIYLLSVLALVGCNEEDVKDLIGGNTKVFAVSGAQVSGDGAGYYSIDDITANSSISTDDLPVGTRDLLVNNGIGIKGETCGQIVIGDAGLCFDKDKTQCAPEELEMLGLAVYTISLGDIQTAADNGFYPKLAADLGGLYVDIDYDDVSCDYLSSL